MSAVFLDTSGLIALVNSDDQWHELAEQAWSEVIAARGTLVTTSLVLIELGDGLSRVQHRSLAVELHDRLYAWNRVEVVQTSRDEESRAWDIYRQRSDKEWGMTDCVSLVVMQDRGVSEVFSADHHFEQAGLAILIKP